MAEIFEQELWLLQNQMQLQLHSRKSLLRQRAQQMHQPQGHQSQTHQNLAHPNQMRGPLAAELLESKLQAVGHLDHLALVPQEVLVATAVVVVKT